MEQGREPGRILRIRKHRRKKTPTYRTLPSTHLSMTIIRMPRLATKPVAMHIYGQEEMKPMSIAPG